MEDKQIFRFPKEWYDDMSMISLLAPFRPKNLNPADWEYKLKFWSDLTLDWSDATTTLFFTQKELMSAFTRDGIPPRCMDVVIAELKRAGELVPKKQIERGGPAESWLKWGYRMFFQQPVELVFYYMSWTDPEAYVAYNIVKDRAHTLLKDYERKIITELVENPVEMSVLLEIYVRLCKNQENLKLILLFLQQNGLVRMKEHLERTVVKFRQKGSQTASEVTEMDLNVINLRETQKLLAKQLESLEKDVKECREAAVQAERKGMRNQTRIFLKKKINLEKLIKKRVVASDNLCGLLDKIQSAKTDAKVIEAYETGLNALKFSVGGKDKGLEKAQDVMADLEQEMENAEELGILMGHPSTSPYETDDLEDELADLMSPPATSRSTPSRVPAKTKTAPKSKEEIDEEFMELERELAELTAGDGEADISASPKTATGTPIKFPEIPGTPPDQRSPLVTRREDLATN